MPATVVAVLGAGTLGLCTIAALRAPLVSPATLIVGAQARRISGAWPHELGAEVVVRAASSSRRAVRRGTRSLEANGRPLTGGADVVVDCVG